MPPRSREDDPVKVFAKGARAEAGHRHRVMAEIQNRIVFKLHGKV
jgi:hypothetical protein